jgi:hypothetical protein
MAIEEIDLDEEAPPLPKMKCKSTDCNNNLHCFQQDKQNSKPVPGGSCRECGAELVSWKRVQERKLEDAAYTFSVLRLERIRHHYFHYPLTEQELNYSKRKGRVGIREAAEKRIRDKVAGKKPFMDGAQTPWTGHILHYAQHATACCCRTCIAEWHGIPAGKEMTEEEIRYLTRLLCMYVEERVPDLTKNGVKIPPIRKKKLSPKG